MDTVWTWLKGNWQWLVFIYAVWTLLKVELWARSTVQVLERISKQIEELQSDVAMLEQRSQPYRPQWHETGLDDPALMKEKTEPRGD